MAVCFNTAMSGRWQCDDAKVKAAQALDEDELTALLDVLEGASQRLCDRVPDIKALIEAGQSGQDVARVELGFFLLMEPLFEERARRQPQGEAP